MASALKVFPQFNASVDAAGEAIVYKKYVHVGIAVDTENGLLVPVVRNADQKNLTQISVDIQALAEKAKARKLSLDEMSGGSMSISNLGGIGGTAFTPIVNWPEVAILGISRGAMEPKWNGTAFEPRQMLPLSLSYDHRLIDGADAIRFLRWVVDALENPFALALRAGSEITSQMPSVIVLGAGPGGYAAAFLPPTSACRSRSSTKRRTRAACASIAAASRRRRCCTWPSWSTSRSTRARGAWTSARRRSTSTSCAPTRTAWSRSSPAAPARSRSCARSPTCRATPR